VFDNQNKEFVNKYNQKVPLRRLASTNDITGALHFLISNESSYITGHNLVVDGGWSAI
jgi:NAD(P)-dependent dehydrogenase (short-subunit alcohol dehydrogenase family)